MPAYTFYDKDGQIHHQIICPESDLENNQWEGLSHIPGHFDAHKFFIENGEPIERQPLQPMINGRTIDGLPNPTTAIIEGKLYEITDGSLTLDPTGPGPFNVTLRSPRHLERTVKLP